MLFDEIRRNKLRRIHMTSCHVREPYFLRKGRSSDGANYHQQHNLLYIVIDCTEVSSSAMILPSAILSLADSLTSYL